MFLSEPGRNTTSVCIFFYFVITLLPFFTLTRLPLIVLRHYPSVFLDYTLSLTWPVTRIPLLYHVFRLPTFLRSEFSTPTPSKTFPKTSVKRSVFYSFFGSLLWRFPYLFSGDSARLSRRLLFTFCPRRLGPKHRTPPPPFFLRTQNDIRVTLHRPPNMFLSV